MSYGGSYNSPGGNGNDWNDQFRDQQQQQLSPGSPGKARSIPSAAAGFGAPQRAAFGNDPFGANDDFSKSDNGFGYETAVVLPVVSTTNTPATTSNSRFGRPSTADMNSDSDFGHHTKRKPQRNSSLNNGSFGGGSAAPSLGRRYSADRYRGGTGGDDPLGRATSDMHMRTSSGQSASLTRSMTDNYGGRGSQASHGSNELNRFLVSSSGAGVSSARGVAVGVASSSVRDPYPSLRNSSTPGAYASSEPSQNVPPAAAARRSSSSSRLLPPKKEATPIMPPSLAVEPTLPRPKVSRRFLPYTKQARQPDLAVAKKVKNARYKAGDDDKHVLKCPNCQSFLKIPKLAVLMQCPTCSMVSPATTSVASV
jgi:hypothetical protein